MHIIDFVLYVLYIYYIQVRFFISYIRDNALAINDIGRTYNSSVPEFLHNRPKWFVKHVMDTMEISRDVVAISKMSEGTFLVRFIYCLSQIIFVFTSINGLILLKYFR